MPSITTTNLDNSTPIFYEGQFEDGRLTFAAAGTVKKGTILARDSVSQKFVPYVKGGVTDGNGIPKAVLTYEVVATAAGDIAIRAAICGITYKSSLIIQADGTGANVTADVLDQLRDYGIVVVSSKELNL